MGKSSVMCSCDVMISYETPPMIQWLITHSIVPVVMASADLFNFFHLFGGQIGQMFHIRKSFDPLLILGSRDGYDPLLKSPEEKYGSRVQLLAAVLGNALRNTLKDRLKRPTVGMTEYRSQRTVSFNQDTMLSGNLEGRFEVYKYVRVVFELCNLRQPLSYIHK